MVKRIYAHLGDVRHRSEAVEYRVEQHLARLGDRLQELGLAGPSVTGNVTGTGGTECTKNPAAPEVKAGEELPESGRPDSNRRRPAWEAGILPLNYARGSQNVRPGAGRVKPPGPPDVRQTCPRNRARHARPQRRHGRCYSMRLDNLRLAPASASESQLPQLIFILEGDFLAHESQVEDQQNFPQASDSSPAGRESRRLVRERSEVSLGNPRSKRAFQGLTVAGGHSVPPARHATAGGWPDTSRDDPGPRSARRGLSAHTVRHHAEAVFAKLGVASRKALALHLTSESDD